MNKRLKDLLERNGRNLSAVARLVGVTPAAVGSWIHERAKPRLKIAKKLQKYCQVPLAFFGYSDDKKTSSKDLCIVYNPSCGCRLDQIVVIDREKMPDSFEASCPRCNNLTYMNISSPPVFYCPIQERYFNLDDNGNPVQKKKKCNATRQG